MKRHNRKRKNLIEFSGRMQKKLAVLFVVILVAFVVLSVRLYIINRDKGEQYTRQILSQQAYDSVTLPARRGEITDRNGTKIAVSEKVYNVVMDSKTLNGEEGKYIEPTLSALFASDVSFTYSQEEIRSFIAANPGSQYRVIAKKQKYEAISGIMEMINNPDDNPNFKGIWLEDTYQRQYPYSSLACDTIGFVQGDNEGAYGLEEYYNDTLVGVNGREYGYLNDDENLERTIKPAEDGKTLVTSLDVNVQSIVEKHILAFNEEHKNEAREGNGSTNTGVIIMNPNTGEVLAMASYPVYDLNNPRDTANIDVDSIEVDPSGYGIMPSEQADADNADAPAGSIAGADSENSEATDNAEDLTEAAGEPADTENVSLNITADNAESAQNANAESEAVQSDASTEGAAEAAQPATYEEAYQQAYEEAKMEAYNALWKNFCINATYEPGSTMKPFTMATGLEEGILTGNESYVCNGYLSVGGFDIHCSNRLGHGPLTFSGALEKSCNVAFMRMGATIGKEVFMKYNQIFNFGLKTNVDLTGEALTNSLIFDVNTMTPTDLAISSFGQGFNVTMIQMITGFSSLINGGYYYKPHLVTKILDSDGAMVESIEPRVLKQTVSEETSDKIRELCFNVVDQGTGKSARPAGYKIGGKTGTAEKFPRGTGNYVVSFMGFAPADDPQIVTYVVIDEPNVPSQASAKYAAVLTRDIMTEVLPYLNIFPTEELSEEEEAELAEKQQEFSEGSTGDTTAEEQNDAQEGEAPEGESAETIQDGNAESDNADSENTQTDEEGANGEDNQTDEADSASEPVIQFDPETGNAIDPLTGDLLDPTTGEPIDGTVSNLQ